MSWSLQLYSNWPWPYCEEPIRTFKAKHCRIYKIELKIEAQNAADEAQEAAYQTAEGAQKAADEAGIEAKNAADEAIDEAQKAADEVAEEAQKA